MAAKKQFADLDFLSVSRVRNLPAPTTLGEPGRLIDKYVQIVTTATSSVSPTAADSGTLYIMTAEGGAIFNAPSTSVVVGQTVFYLQFSDSSNSVGQIHLSTGSKGYGLICDGGSIAGNVWDEDIGNIYAQQIIELRYIGTKAWSYSGFAAV
jgi:hypothetical protein